MGPPCTAALAQESPASGTTSWTTSITSGFKKGFDKLGQAFKPKSSAVAPGPEDDAISLKNSGKAGPGVNVAWAHLSEQKGDLGEAEKQYQSALNLKSDYLPAILGYAQLEERLDRPQDAMKLYQRAAKLYPRQASVHNNAGLCYARQGLLDQAVASIARAVELDPKNPLYRNNIATVLVDKGMTREAFAQLRAVHGEAEANYNLGFLLNKKGQKQESLKYFTLALQSNPSMDSAKRWIDYLRKRDCPDFRANENGTVPLVASRLAGLPVSNGVKVVGRPATPQERNCPNFRDRENGTDPFRATQENLALPQGSAAPPPEETRPLRLPPIKSQRSEKEGTRLPGISYDPTPTAPLPPPITNSALLQPLPRVR